MVPNQGLQGIAFFEATVCLTLLVLFLHLKGGNPAKFLSPLALRMDIPDGIVVRRAGACFISPT